jgi:hypothetical protein
VNLLKTAFALENRSLVVLFPTAIAGYRITKFRSRSSSTRGTNRGQDGIYRLMLHVVEGLAFERIGSFECGANSPGMSWDRFKL